MEDYTKTRFDEEIAARSREAQALVEAGKAVVVDNSQPGGDKEIGRLIGEGYRSIAHDGTMQYLEKPKEETE